MPFTTRGWGCVNLWPGKPTDLARTNRSRRRAAQHPVQHQSAATGPVTTVPSKAESTNLLAGTTLNDRSADSSHRGAQSEPQALRRPSGMLRTSRSARRGQACRAAETCARTAGLCALGGDQRQSLGVTLSQVRREAPCRLCVAVLVLAPWNEFAQNVFVCALDVATWAPGPASRRWPIGA